MSHEPRQNEDLSQTVSRLLPSVPMLLLMVVMFLLIPVVLRLIFPDKTQVGALDVDASFVWIALTPIMALFISTYLSRRRLSAQTPMRRKRRRRGDVRRTHRGDVHRTTRRDSNT